MRRNKRWQRSEDLTALNFDGRLVPGSGAGEEKLDVVILSGPLKGARIENKYTDKVTYSLTKKDLKKARNQAKDMGCDHFMLIDMQDDLLNLRYVCIPETTFLNLIAQIQK